jgi:hypothetical protein
VTPGPEGSGSRNTYGTGNATSTQCVKGPDCSRTWNHRADRRAVQADWLVTPGIMSGLAGIGYGMLRLAEPDSVPVVLTLQP